MVILHAIVKTTVMYSLLKMYKKIKNILSLDNKKRLDINQSFFCILELMTGIGPVTPTLPRWCSTSEPHQHILANKYFLLALLVYDIYDRLSIIFLLFSC